MLKDFIVAQSTLDRFFSTDIAEIDPAVASAHLMLVDVRAKNLTGKLAEQALGRAHITCNKNGIPFDPEKPTITSGIRLGTAAATSRGFGQKEFEAVGRLIAEVLDAVAISNDGTAPMVEAAVKQKVAGLTAAFPIYRTRSG
jgi:glycine hydroxymethyltransferase